MKLLIGETKRRKKPIKSVLISIGPKWCELIASGKKTIEVRKTRPKIETPFKCYIYCTKPKMITKYVFKPEDYPEYMRPEKTVFCKVPDASSPFCSEVNGNGKVIGEFVCDRIELFDSAASEFAYAVAPSDISCVMPMSEDKSMKICNKQGCMSNDDVISYFGDEDWKAYFWHISDLKIYDNPKELSEFTASDKKAIRQCKNREQSYYAFTDTGYIKNGFYCNKKDDWCFGECKRKALTRPPQSWCYVDELP